MNIAAGAVFAIFFAASIPAEVPASQPSTQSLSGKRVQADGKTLRPPKGYEHLRPAKLYTFSKSATMFWIVARDRAQAEFLMTQALGIGTETSRSAWSRCLQRQSSCPEPIVELGFGWMATIGAQSPDGASVKHFYAYEARSRQAAIDLALADYRAGHGNMVIQSLRVGLVSEIPWDELLRTSEEFGRREGGENPSDINYRTRCDWSDLPGQRGRNRNPDIFSGNTRESSACNDEYRRDEKLPIPVLLAG